MTKPNVLIIADDADWHGFACELIGANLELADFVLVHTVKKPPARAWDFARMDFSRYLGSGTEVPDIVIGGVQLRDFELILSLHCQQILPSGLVNNVRCVNIHPGYLPYGKGWRPVAFALALDIPAGATLHVMNEDVDAGPIIDRIQVYYGLEDTARDVYLRIQEKEKNLVRLWMSRLISGDYEVKHIRLKANVDPGLMTKGDYDNLCDLGTLDRDNNHWATISHLAGLTYGDQANAFFCTPEGDKVRVGIFMEKIDDNGKS